jgi:hypothetical protein
MSFVFRVTLSHDPRPIVIFLMPLLPLTHLRLHPITVDIPKH